MTADSDSDSETTRTWNDPSEPAGRRPRSPPAPHPAGIHSIRLSESIRIDPSHSVS